MAARNCAERRLHVAGVEPMQRTAAKRQPAASCARSRRRARDGRQRRRARVLVQRGIDCEEAPACTDAAGRRRGRRRCACSTTRPPYITRTRSATSATTPRSWVIEHHAHAARRPCSCAISSRICAWIVTSSAVVGSSAMRSCGLARRAPSRSSPAAACRRTARAGTRRCAARDRGCRPRASSVERRACGLRVGTRVRALGSLGDLPADRVDRIQRGHRILEDHGDARAADLRISRWDSASRSWPSKLIAPA